MPNPKSAACDGADVLNEMAAFIRRYLVCDDHQLTLLTLWSACTHCYNYFRTAPYLHVHSPQPHCGKSLCLNLLADLSDADVVFTGILAAPLLDRLLQDRSLEEKSSDALRRMPVLIDDYQHSFSPSERQPLVCLLASGLESNCFFAWGEMEYSLFSPKALAGNSPLPRSLAARCIPIVLRRPRPTEKFDRYAEENTGRSAETLRARLKNWLKQASSALAQTAKDFPTDLPPTLSPGQSKSAAPLVHIADVAGGVWPKKVRAAIVASFDLAEANPELQILFDLRSIFHEYNDPEYLATADLLSQLRTLESRPWSGWTSKSGRRLAGLLRPFGIASHRLHLTQEDDFMGYLLKDFQDAWERYLPASSPGMQSERIAVSSATNAAQPAAKLFAVGAD